MGRVDEVAVIAARGRRIEHGVDGLLLYLTAFGEVRALALAGEFDSAEKRSADIVRICSAGQYLAWGMGNVLSGTIEVARGNFLDAIPRMEQTVAALTSESAAAWSFPARLLLAQSYCALGRAEPGAKMVAELRTRFGRHVAVFGPQLRIAESWLAAAEGNVSGAIVLALDAARQAKESGQQAIEMLALHDAVRYGDRSSLARLVEVAHATGGRLATALAAHAAAVTDRNADAIYAAAQQLEQIGALLLAADAAAQAAAAYQAADDRRHAGVAAGTANRLAAACGGLRTPALDLAGSPLPLTVREREIANLVAAGLTNRDIADRLTVSVRTVEGHLYRACTKCRLHRPRPARRADPQRPTPIVPTHSRTAATSSASLDFVKAPLFDWTLGRALHPAATPTPTICRTCSPPVSRAVQGRRRRAVRVQRQIRPESAQTDRCRVRQHRRPARHPRHPPQSGQCRCARRGQRHPPRRGTTAVVPRSSPGSILGLPDPAHPDRYRRRSGPWRATTIPDHLEPSWPAGGDLDGVLGAR